MSLLSPQLLAFMAIAQHKTVHAAANEIHLTQTAVTQRIRTLEKHLQTSLFIRTRRGMLLTPEGEALLRYCLASKELEIGALAAIQGTGTETEVELRISAPTSIMRSRVIPSCLPVISAFPQLLLDFNVDDKEHRHQLLRSGSTDFVIIREEHLAREMQYKKLKPEQYVLVGSPKWKNRKLTSIIQQERIIDFDPADNMTFNYLKHHQLLDNAKYSRHFVNRTENLALLVSEGVGYTTLTKEFAQPYIQSKQLIILNKGKAYDVFPMLAWFDRAEPPAYFKAIIGAIN